VAPGPSDYRFNAVLAEEWGHFNAATAACFGIHADVCPPYIVDLGTQEQKQRWLPGIATGEKIIAIGMTEPSGWFGPRRAQDDRGQAPTTAPATGLSTGPRPSSPTATSATCVIVAARTDPSKGPKGITLFMVERGMEGFVNGRKLDKVGQDESDTAELFFENVRVPDTNRLGPEGMGFIAMMQRLPQERIGAAVSNIAHAFQIFRETVAYAKERKAFGQSIGMFQYNKFKLAEMHHQA
jgi:alkylation response protein AidB-like acyl-CoA dehydrogenase